MPDGIDAFNQSPGIGVTCGDCSAHFDLDPAGDVAGSACSECGGKRFFRTQPSPVHDDLSGDNIMKDMPPAGGGPDTGGNPLGEGSIIAALMGLGYTSNIEAPGLDTQEIDQFGIPIRREPGTMAPNQGNNPDLARGQAGFPLSEGTIVGQDGEPSPHADTHGYDGYTHSHVKQAEERLPEGPADMYYKWQRPSGEMTCPGCFGQGCPACRGKGVVYAPNLGDDGVMGIKNISPDDVTHQIDRNNLGPMHAGGLYQTFNITTNMNNYTTTHSRETLNTEPYALLWSDEHVAGLGGILQDIGKGALALGTNGLAIGELGLNPAADAAAGVVDGSLLGGAASTLMNHAVGGAAKGVAQDAASNMFGGNGGGGATGGGMFPTQTPVNQLIGSFDSADIPALLAAKTADLETPGSVKSVDEQHDDPEEQDQKEFNDGDKSPSNHENPNNEDSGASGEDGVRDATPGYGFGPNSPAIQHMQGVLPLLLHYITNGITGDDDPILQDLDKRLESENPGYRNNEHPDGPKMMEIIIQQHGKGKDQRTQSRLATVPLAPVPTPASNLGQGAMPGSDIHPSLAKPQSCPNCGGTINGDGTCPQCGFPAAGAGFPTNQMPMPQQITASHQGPQTPEQFEAASQYLTQNGQQGLIQQLYQHPENFGWLMNEIQQNPQPTAPLIDPGQSQPAPPGAMPSAPGAMPVIDPSQPGGGGGQPMQPMSAFSDMSVLRSIADLRRNLPMAVQHQIDDMLTHYGPQYTLSYIKQLPSNTGVIANTGDANNLVNRCPYCDSATTSILDGGDGEDDHKHGHCHSCQRDFPLHEKNARQSQMRLVALTNPALDPQRTWVDTNGHPIQEGDQYSLYTAGVPVPDEVTVVAKKPGELQLQLAGTSADFRISPGDLQNGKYSFEPATNSAAFNNEIPHGNHSLDNANVIPEPTTDEATNMYPNDSVTSAHNNDGSCHKCGSDDTNDFMSSPTTTMHECYRCSAVWETKDNDYGSHQGNSQLDWLMNGDDDSFAAEMAAHREARDTSGASRNIREIATRDPRLAEIRERLETNQSIRGMMEHNAGKNFSQSEKRALIDEHGHARNFDQLDLNNTHYRVDEEYISRRKGNGMDVPDSHLVLGL
jgi:hypothetical protein